jgi:hypothetical protein
MDVYTMMYEVLCVSDAMVGKSPFPDFHWASQLVFHGVRVAAFDELHRSFQRYPYRSQQQMKMLGHEDKRVKLELSLAAIGVERFEEEAGHWFGYEQAPSLPGGRCYKISARR